MPANGRFDGHIVQGHVDQTGIVTSIIDNKGSWTYTIEYNNKFRERNRRKRKYYH